jgi:hypothetical protein
MVLIAPNEIEPDSFESGSLRLRLSGANRFVMPTKLRYIFFCTSPEKTDTKINLSVTSYEFGPCKENVHLEADTTLGFNLLF